MDDDFIIQLGQIFKEDNVDQLNNCIGDFDIDAKLPTNIKVEDTFYFPAILQGGATLFGVACYYGAINCIHSLFNLGANPDEPDATGKRSYHYASAGNNVNILEFIRSRTDIDFLTPDQGGRTFLHIAAEHNALNVLQWAYSNNFPLDISSEFYGSPIHFACIRRHLRCIEFLCSLNIERMNKGDWKEEDLPIDLNRRTIGQRTPLLLVINNFLFEAIPMMIKANLDVNAPTISGWPIICYAIRSRNASLVKILCKYGADVNVICEHGWTPMHIAAQERLPEIINILFSKGAKPMALTTFRRSPFSFSRGFHIRDKELQTAQKMREVVVSQCAKSLISHLVSQMMANDDDDVYK